MPHDAKDGGKATFTVTIPENAIYTVMAKVRGIDNAANSFWIRIDDREYQRLGNYGELDTWTSIIGPSWRRTCASRARQLASPPMLWIDDPIQHCAGSGPPGVGPSIKAW